jgi:hypothetical protein
MLQGREHYMFSAYGGEGFLRAWRESRQRNSMDAEAARRVLEGKGAATVPPPGSVEIRTMLLLEQMVAMAVQGDVTAPFAGWREVFLKKFEVHKRLREGYGLDLKARGGSAPDLAYSRLALVLASEPGLDGDLRRLNALLKVHDLALSAQNDERGAACLSLSTRLEVMAVDAVTARCASRT